MVDGLGALPKFHCDQERHESVNVHGYVQQGPLETIQSELYAINVSVIAGTPAITAVELAVCIRQNMVELAI